MIRGHGIQGQSVLSYGMDESGGFSAAIGRPGYGYGVYQFAAEGHAVKVQDVGTLKKQVPVF